MADSRLGSPSKYAMPDKIPREWDAYTAETIEKNFERIFKATQRATQRADDVEDAAAADFMEGPTPAASIDSEVALFDGTTGRLLKRAAISGLATLTSGVLSAFTMATARILGRTTAGTGAPEQLTLSQVLDLIGSPAQGDLLYRGAAAWARLGAGTSGHFLQTQGAAANPQWASAAASIQTLLDGISTTQGVILYYNGTDWVALSPGTSGQFLKTQGAAADPIWDDAGGGSGALSTGTGHPQGAESAAVGSLYVDLTTGRLYQKLGGGSTAYGWYYRPLHGAGIAFDDAGPLTWVAMPGNGTTNPFGNATDFFLNAGAVSTPFIGSSLSSQGRTYVSGKLFAHAQTGGASGNTAAITTQTSNPHLLLDDDCDITLLLRTGSDVTNVRIWFGLSTVGGGSFNSDTLGSAGNGSIALRYSTVAGDGGWVGATQLNGAGNQTLTSALSSGVNADTTYKLRIRFVRQGTPTVYFSVDDGTEQSITTNIPAAGTTPIFLGLGWATQEGAAKQLLWRAWGATYGS